jgi:hypothetical protein
MTHAPQKDLHFRQPQPRKDNRLGWAGLLLAVCGLTLFWIPMVYPAAGVAAVVLSAVGYSKARAGTATNGKSAMLGIVLGSLAVVLPVVVLIGVAFYAASGG